MIPKNRRYQVASKRLASPPAAPPILPAPPPGLPGFQSVRPPAARPELDASKPGVPKTVRRRRRYPRPGYREGDRWPRRKLVARQMYGHAPMLYIDEEV